MEVCKYSVGKNILNSITFNGHIRKELCWHLERHLKSNDNQEIAIKKIFYSDKTMKLPSEQEYLVIPPYTWIKVSVTITIFCRFLDTAISSILNIYLLSQLTVTELLISTDSYWYLKYLSCILLCKTTSINMCMSLPKRKVFSGYIKIPSSATQLIKNSYCLISEGDEPLPQENSGRKQVVSSSSWKITCLLSRQFFQDKAPVQLPWLH